MRYLLLLLLMTLNASAEEVQSIQDMGNNLLGSFTSFANLLLNISFLAGIGFGVTAAYKFKQHKDNPAQVSIGQALAMLFISIFLVFLPGMYLPAGASMFGGSVALTAGGTTGQGLTDMPGGVSALPTITATH